MQNNLTEDVKHVATLSCWWDLHSGSSFTAHRLCSRLKFNSGLRSRWCSKAMKLNIGSVLHDCKPEKNLYANRSSVHSQQTMIEAWFRVTPPTKAADTAVRANSDLSSANKNLIQSWNASTVGRHPASAKHYWANQYISVHFHTEGKHTASP